MSYFINAILLLIEFFFNILIGLVIFRVLLQWVRADFYNPICQFLYKTTNPIMMPLRRIIPPWRNLDMAGIVLAWLLIFLKRELMVLLLGQQPGLIGLAVIAFADLLGFVLSLYLILILVRVVLSFVSGGSYNPAVPLVFQLTEPILKPIRRRLPMLGGMDFSPMAAWLAIMLARLLIVAPLLDAGSRLAQMD